jgi:hypothetical protein
MEAEVHEMTMFKLTWAPYVYTNGYEQTGEEQVLATGTEEECRAAWDRFVSEQRFYGVDKTPDKYASVGLLAKLGTLFSISVGRMGRLVLSLAPELTRNPVFEVRPAAERDAWVPAGDTQAEAEVTMRRMGDGPGRLLILRNNGIGELSVWQANSLGYLDFKGTHEQFYGTRP